ncbi:Mov34/MPN/PAD-1 family protein [Brevibacillus fulvus]|uniref:Proteasome lid subunit RPN8/RPN11 n=1 Tax=Brevibacillus fulvus TaxID=1125967 RepID=A0A938XVQ2_9BACL|nr:Mov34/MPN/PAD-1 family protein [Brevibacillus fulvus]MBM7591022.1 proteasome lid subunit RPN8/RPN11 [Brevibacillus fulvus]
MLTDLLGDPFANKDTKICIDRKVLKHLLAEAESALPFEYSALLAGRANAISQFVAAPAASRQPAAFVWEGPDFFASLRKIKADGLLWQGVLHTHPATLPLPSTADRQGWHYPMLSYWILSFPGGKADLRLYRYSGNRFVQHDYEIR